MNRSYPYPWRKMFRVVLREDLLMIVTPWLLLKILDVSYAVDADVFQSGITIAWGRNRSPRQGEMLYLHGRQWIMEEFSHEHLFQRLLRGRSFLFGTGAV